jgi:hypothetical protein
MTQDYPLDPSPVDPGASPPRGAYGSDAAFPARGAHRSEAFGASSGTSRSSDRYGSAGQPDGYPVVPFGTDDAEPTVRAPLASSGTVLPPEAGDRRAARAGSWRPRRPFAWLVDARGLTFVGAVLVAGIIGTIGGVVDAGAHAWVGNVFAIMFVAGCALAVLLVHREDLITMAFLPPVLFVAIASAVGVAQAVQAHGSIKDRLGFQVLYALAFGGRMLWIATGVTVAAVVLRFAFRRRPAPRAAYRPSL